MDLAKEIPDAIALGRGDPDLDAPPRDRRRPRRRARSPPAPGADPRDARAARRDRPPRRDRPRCRRHGPEHVLVTTGGQEGLFLVMQALLDPGDEILVPDPRYTSYDQAIEHCGAVSVTVPTHPTRTPSTCAPRRSRRSSPPDQGAAARHAQQPHRRDHHPRRGREDRGAGAQARLRGHLRRDLRQVRVAEPHEHVSIGALPGMADRTITLSGFSKAWAMTGFRVGYVIAPPSFVDGMAAIKAATTGPVAGVSQAAALAAAEGPTPASRRRASSTPSAAALLADGLTGWGSLRRAPRRLLLLGDAASTGLRALELSYLLLREAHVLVFPGNAFGDALERLPAHHHAAAHRRPARGASSA
jgi:aminotransferase